MGISKIDNLAKAKSVLILDQPFFASILLSLPMVEDKSIPTFATNGDEIRYNPDFLETLTLQETVFILAHETMHCVLQHMHRRGERDSAKWNIAADHVINDLLEKEKVGTMPKGGLLDRDLIQRGNGTTEGVYSILPDSPHNNGRGNGGNGQPKAGEPGGPLDDCQDAGKDEAERAAKEAEMRVKVVQASNAAKMADKLSENMKRIVGDVTTSRIDWRAILRRFLSERAKVDLSYSKPKRRFLADDIYLPSLVGEKMGAIVVAVDCSGSINDEILNKFTTEIKAIVADVSPTMVHVIYFDSRVLRCDSFGPDDALIFEPHGGGGTRFAPIFEYVEENQLQPCACVVLTDLECSDFGETPSYPVLWASIQDGAAPFGEIVRIKE